MGRTLITGGAGYIGIELVDELLQAGREVTVLDRLLHGQTDRAQELRERGVTVVEGDIRDTVARGHALRRRRGGGAPGGDRRRPGLRA